MELDTNGSPAKLAAEAAAAKLDIMCYALALLTNILQKEPRMAELVGKRGTKTPAHDRYIWE